MSINTTQSLHTFLETNGHATTLSGDSVCVALGTSNHPYTAAFTFHEDTLRITCQVALLGDLDEAKIAQICLAALNANMQISPYAFAVIGAAVEDVAVAQCPLVLTDTLLTKDLSEEEVTFSIVKLLEALAFSEEILALGQAPAKSSP